MYNIYVFYYCMCKYFLNMCSIIDRFKNLRNDFLSRNNTKIKNKKIIRIIKN